MTAEQEASPVALPALLIRIQGYDRALQPGSRYRIGRDPQSDVVLDDPTVSWLHAVFRADSGQWLLEDAGSTNGTFVGRDRVERVEITGACLISLGHQDLGPAVSCSLAAAPAVPAAPAGPPSPEITARNERIRAWCRDNGIKNSSGTGWAYQTNTTLADYIGNPLIRRYEAYLEQQEKKDKRKE